MNYANGIIAFCLIITLIVIFPFTLYLTKFFKRKVESMIDSWNEASEPALSPPLANNPSIFSGKVRVAEHAQAGSNPQPLNAALVWHYIFPGIIVCCFLVYLVYWGNEYPGIAKTSFFIVSVSFPFIFILHTVTPPGKNWLRPTSYVYLIILTVFGIYFLFRNDIEEVILLFLTIPIYNSIPTLVFFWLNSSRRTKALAPFVFPVVFSGISLVTIGLTYLFASDERSKGIYNPIHDLFFYLGIPSITNFGFYLMLALILLLIVLLSLIILRVAYNFKITNSRILLIDCIWITQLIFLLGGPFSDFRAILYPLLVFACYKILQLCCMKIVNSTKHKSERELLVLRVFALGQESEKLFRHVSAAWLSKGSIKLIAGHDLTTTLVDIDDLLVYLSGRIKERFCLTETLMKKNIDKMDTAPDIDGSYRVNELYCNNSTWQMVLNRILPDTDRILMDLRGFSSGNSGCIHEIEQLVSRIPLNKVLFISDHDGTAEGSYLRSVMQKAWERLPANSPNYGNELEKFHIYKYNGTQDLSGLIDTLTA